ncbi:hypothetical protein DFS34DRAFT_632813 [Phlyctochytrium arcticum]|nr:hypothetical protein DFS34DRAFT_632813 [Phlyctochytrium arcticum]
MWSHLVAFAEWFFGTWSSGSSGPGGVMEGSARGRSTRLARKVLSTKAAGAAVAGRLHKPTRLPHRASGTGNGISRPPPPGSASPITHEPSRYELASAEAAPFPENVYEFKADGRTDRCDSGRDR